jgi:WD40 repeat protein
VYSLDQFKDNSKYLFSSSNDSTINIYQLNTKFEYDLIQTIQKTQEKKGGEINKVIALSNKLLVSGDHRSITIWKQEKINENNKINYREYHEIVVKEDTCHLLEVNPSIFIATQYTRFQVYKNDDKTFPLIGKLDINSHGNSSNGLAKINDNIVCSGSKEFLFVLSIIPLQVIQKISMNIYKNIYFVYTTKDNYLYCKGDSSINQYRIIKDDNNNFIELFEIWKYPINGRSFLDDEKAIASFDDGRIFFVENKNGVSYYQLYV